MIKSRRKMTWAEAVKRATIEPKSQQVVDEVRRQLESEGLSGKIIEDILQNVMVLPDENEVLLH